MQVSFVVDEAGSAAAVGSAAVEAFLVAEAASAAPVVSLAAEGSAAGHEVFPVAGAFPEVVAL